MPQFGESVYKKHILPQQGFILFTSAQRSFARLHAPLRVAVVAALAPCEDWDAQANAPAGIFTDILALIGQRSGLRFTFPPVQTLTEARQLLDTGQADLTRRRGGGRGTHLHLSGFPDDSGISPQFLQQRRR